MAPAWKTPQTLAAGCQKLGTLMISDDGKTEIGDWLVVTGTMEFYDFPFSWEVHHPNWRTQIFQRGRYTTTRWSLNHRWLLNPSGKHTKNDGKSQLFIEKYIISMAMFNSEVSKMTRGLSSHWRLDRKLQPESHGSFPSQLSSLL